MDKVVSLKGDPIHDPRTPDETVIRECERLLEEAKSGEVIGVAYATYYFDKSTNGRRAGTVSYSLVGRCENLKAILLSDMEKA